MGGHAAAGWFGVLHGESVPRQSRLLLTGSRTGEKRAGCWGEPSQPQPDGFSTPLDPPTPKADPLLPPDPRSPCPCAPAELWRGCVGLGDIPAMLLPHISTQLALAPLRWASLSPAKPALTCPPPVTS